MAAKLMKLTQRYYGIMEQSAAPCCSRPWRWVRKLLDSRYCR